MGLIEDARALAESDPTREDSSSSPGTCRYCGGETVGGLLTMRVLHADTCPWLALPRIVAALEAAQQVVRDGCCRRACCNDQRHDDCAAVALAGGG